VCLGVRAHSLNGMVGKPLGYISNLRCLVEACVEMAQILWTTQKIILFHFESGLRKRFASAG
jgi:hypothetical protein